MPIESFVTTASHFPVSHLIEPFFSLPSTQGHATLPKPTYNKALLRTEKAILQYYKVLQSTSPVLLCTTKYDSVLQSTTLHYRLQSTTPYYKVLLHYFKVPLQYYKVLLRTTKHYSSTTKKYYSSLQSTTPVLLCTTKYYSSTVPYYSVLQSTTKYYSTVLLCTTKCDKVLLRTEKSYMKCH